MAPETNSEDEALLATYGATLADGIEAALPRWVEAAVAKVSTAWSGDVPADVAAAASEAGQRAKAEVAPAVRALLAQDVDEQRTTPLAIVRGAVRFPTEVLRAAGVPPVVRDELAESAFPDDDYALSPGSFSDLDPALAEPGLVWGAAKAHVVISRRKQGPR